MKDFNEFIYTMELQDLPMLGRSFTWCNDVEGERWSRLDRFILDIGWLEKFSFKQWGLNRSISDHCPVIIMTDERDWGPKPFRCIIMLGAYIQILWLQLRLHGIVVRWNSEVFGNVDEKLKKPEDELHEWDLNAESRDLQEFEKSRRREVQGSVWDLKIKKENMWQQKSRLLWTENGDKNSRVRSHHSYASSLKVRVAKIAFCLSVKGSARKIFSMSLIQAFTLNRACKKLVTVLFMILSIDSVPLTEDPFLLPSLAITTK
ncbi:uncharacterized protein LOC114321704 [Camellia sinensis]|uniref:uncharacterized protein LOC114321704 n=1 Tax=Camellia sinensis TaxID=4442 RepID=UPI001035E735|nr:uncharacterized protein LOC114321704 [Camellia sinensis]